MKKIAILLFLMVCVVVTQAATPVLAEQEGTNPVGKLGRGFTHFVLAPFHIPREMIQETAEEETTYIAPWKGATYGIGKGIYQMGRQFVSGLTDIFTFWHPSEPLYEYDGTLFPEV